MDRTGNVIIGACIFASKAKWGRGNVGELSGMMIAVDGSYLRASNYVRAEYNYAWPIGRIDQQNLKNVRPYDFRVESLE